MDANDLCVLAAGAAASVLILNEKKSKAWIKKKWLLKRRFYGDNSLLRELSNFEEDYRNFLRMDEHLFVELLELVTPLIKKKDTVMRECIKPCERLSSTLRFLATGRSFADLKFSSRISAQSFSSIIPETCHAIYNVLKDDYLKFPQSEEEWEEIAQHFYYKWSFPNCMGAIDGKHISIVRPVNSGSYFYNYKGYYSVVLMAVVNANYEFIYCHVGTNGRVSDGGVIEYTDFYYDLVNCRLKIPPPKCPNNYNTPVPYVFISDEAFRLRKDMIKPYSRQHLNTDREYFNKKLSGARQVVENAFGILSSRFRVFHTKINLSLQTTDYVVLASCALHNFLRRRNPNYIELTTTQIQNENTDGLRSAHYRHIDLEGANVRDQFLEYFIATKNV